MNGVDFFTPSGLTARFYNAVPKFSLPVSFNRPYGYLCLQQGGWNNLDEGAKEKLVCCMILYFVLFMGPTNYQIYHISSEGCIFFPKTEFFINHYLEYRVFINNNGQFFIKRGSFF